MAKRNLADLNFDEFVTQAFDDNSEASEFDANEFQKSNKKTKTNREHLNNFNIHETKLKPTKNSKRLKSSLKSLKYTDPEFHKFLEKNDKELLNLEISDTGGETCDDSIDSLSDSELGVPETVPDDVTSWKKRDKNKKKDAASEDIISDLDEKSSDNAEENDSSVGNGDKDDVNDDMNTTDLTQEEEKSIRKVTDKQVKFLTQGLKMKQSFAIYREAVEIFHLALRQVGGDSSSNVELTFENTDTFNQLAICCLQGIPEFLIKILGCKNEYIVIKSRIGKKIWPKVKRATKSFCRDIIYLLRNLTDTSILILTLQSIQPLLSLFMILRDIRKSMLKSIVTLWSRDNLKLQLCCHMFIAKISLLTREGLYRYLLKCLYKEFVSHSRFFSEQNEMQIGFMKESLIEILSRNLNSTNQFALMCIKHLAVQIRNVVISKKSDSIQNIYSWQFIQSLELWCRVFSSNISKTDPKFSELIFPLVELTKGTISLNPTVKFYPLRFRLIHSLNRLSYSTRCYIPLVHQILEPLDYIREISHFTKITIKPPHFDNVIKVGKQLQKTLPFVDYILNTSFELILEHLACYENSISFPEMVFVLNKELRKFAKSSKNTNYKNKIKSLIEKIEQQSAYITIQRSVVKFGPSETNKVTEWQNSIGNTQHLLGDYLELWRATEKSNASYTEATAKTNTKIRKPLRKETRRISHKIIPKPKINKRVANGKKSMPTVVNSSGYGNDNDDDIDHIYGGTVSKLRLEDWSD